MAITASAGARGTDVRIRTGGHHLAVRRTAPDVVHLVGTAAGPLGGDEVEIHLDVGPGARLDVRSAAATIVLPGRERADSVWSVVAAVADGGWLRFAPEPTVVCAGAEHASSTSLDLAGDATAHLIETVVLGRCGEVGGIWTGKLAASRDGLALLRQTTRSHWLVADGARVLSTDLHTGTAVAHPPATRGLAVAMPLAGGGRLVTTTGTDVSSATADRAAVQADPAPATA